eukprot:1932029-Ditylum_brightwellii.AAC.1
MTNGSHQGGSVNPRNPTHSGRGGCPQKFGDSANSKTDYNETDAILIDVDENFLNLQEEVLLVNLGWIKNYDDELMDMTAIFYVLDLE